MGNILRNFKYINFKTLYFNFKYLPLSVAIKFPIWVASNTYIKSAKGVIRISAPIKTGMIRLGCGNIGIFDDKKSRGIWQVAGSLEFCGKARLGHGFKVSVGPSGKIVFGKNFRISAETALVALNEISFGENVLLSWDILVMDNDFHKILNKENVQINNPKPIIFGNDIWVGCRSTILKGVTIADNNVIAAGTILSKSIPESGNVVGGNPIGVIKNDIQWQR